MRLEVKGMSRSFPFRALFMLTTCWQFSQPVCSSSAGRSRRSGRIHRIHSEFANSARAERGAPMSASGESALRTVRSIRLPQDGPTVKSRFMRSDLAKEHLKANVEAGFRSHPFKSEGSLGDKYVEISFGSEEGEKTQRPARTIDSRASFRLSRICSGQGQPDPGRESQGAPAASKEQPTIPASI